MHQAIDGKNSRQFLIESSSMLTDCLNSFFSRSMVAKIPVLSTGDYCSCYMCKYVVHKKNHLRMYEGGF